MEPAAMAPLLVERTQIARGGIDASRTTAAKLLLAMAQRE
jgi:hypothetical protein